MIRACVLAVAAVLASGVASGQMLTWTASGSSANTSSGTSVEGAEFTLSSALTATHLGYYDDTFASADGLTNSHAVGLYDGVTQQLVASAVVPAGTGATKINRFRMVAISPVALQAGRLYVVAGVSDVDPTINVSVGSGTLQPAAGVTVGRWIAAFQGTLAFPTFQFSTTVVRLGAVVGFSAAPPTGVAAWNPAHSSNSTGNSGTSGIEFSVSAPMTVRGMGVYDDAAFGPDGLAAAHAVGVYDVTTEGLLGQATVSAGTGAALSGRMRYASVAGIRLRPGRRYVSAAVLTGDGSVIVGPNELLLSPRVNVHAWRFGGATLTFPTTLVSSPNFGVGPGMLLEAGCPIDYDASGDATVQDVFEFLEVWFGQLPGADFNGVDGISVQDIFDYLNAWFLGCV